MTTDPYMDPLDERLKAAMKALGDQVSDRYFEELPDRTIARLEELMHSSEVDRNASGPGPKSVVPVAAKPEARREEPRREEDSGLHDIRALAQSTKQRMSQRRIPTQNPPLDENVLATSSASLRAVALPDPDKMVALEQPIIGNGTGSAPAIKADKADRASAKKILDKAAAATAAASTAPAATPITPLRAAAKKPSKTPMIVLGGVFAAAAAGVIGFMVIKNNKDTATSADTASAGAATPVEVTPIAEEQAPAPARAAAPGSTADSMAIEGAAEKTTATGSGAAANAALIADGIAGDDSVAKGRGKDEAEKADRHDRKKDDKDRDKKDDKDKKIAPDVKAPPPTDTTKKPGDKKEESLDDLLRGAGVDPDAAKKKEAPKLEKKALDAADIRKGMSALNGKAQGCYAKFGVSGSVAVKLTVAPSGEVKTTKVTGSFAGTPTGDCVAGVAANAKFPAWDGSPSTVNYSYFLSE